MVIALGPWVRLPHTWAATGYDGVVVTVSSAKRGLSSVNLWGCLRESARYWERKRLLYNAVLIVLSLVCWGQEIFSQGPRAWLGGGLVLLLFGGVANLLYSSVYFVELCVPMGPLRQLWAKVRWMLFAAGTGLAAVLALFILLGDGMG